MTTNENIRPLLDYIASQNLYVISKERLYLDKKYINQEDAIDYLKSKFNFKIHEFAEWDKIKRSSDQSLAFISRYHITRILEIKGDIHIDYFNLEYFYVNSNPDKWSTENSKLAFLEFNLACGRNLQFVQNKEMIMYFGQYIENGNFFEAVKYYSEKTRSENNIKFIKTSNYEGDDILTSSKIMSTINFISGMSGNDFLGDIINKTKNDQIRKTQFWHGTAPFCDGHPDDCSRYAGKLFAPVLNKDISEKDRESYGASCWTGEKVLCRYNPSSAIESGIFEQYGLDPTLMNFELKWYGTAPFCDPEPCQIWSDGYIPIFNDEYGDGSRCVTGRKILAIKPLTVNKEQQLLLDQWKSRCKELLLIQAENMQKFIKLGVIIGAKIIKSIV